jgi:hypothetical protein
VLPVAEFPRGPRTQSLPENETQIERPNVNQLALQNIFAASQKHSPHGAGFVAVLSISSPLFFMSRLLYLP